MALSFTPLARRFPSFLSLLRFLPWQENRRSLAEIFTRGAKNKQIKSSSRTPLERVAEASRQGKSLVYRGPNPRLDRYLANTPIELCRDKEWENMHDVGKEIVD